jgi:putative ABC transport system permease protein
MNIWQLAAKNLFRRKIRTALTIAGIAVAVAVLVSLMGFDAGYQRSLDGDIDKMGYQVLVTAKGCPYEAATLMLKGGGGLRYMEDAVYKKIVADPRIDKITPQLVHTLFDPNKNNGQGGLSLYMGIEKSYIELKPWVAFKAGKWFSNPTAKEVILGYEAAELEQRNVGDKVFLPGINEVLEVVGIFERTGTQDDGIQFIPLGTAQSMFGLDSQLTGIGIKLEQVSALRAFEEDLYNEPGIQVISMAQVKGTIFNLMSSAKVMTNAVAVIAVIVAVIGVVNTILMSVFERTKEIGVLKAIGASRWDVFSLIWLETIFFCLIGGVLGSGLAFGGSVVVESVLRTLLPYTPSGTIVFITPGLILKSLGGAVLLGVFAGFYPAYRASSTHPVTAIRMAE